MIFNEWYNEICATQNIISLGNKKLINLKTFNL